MNDPQMELLSGLLRLVEGGEEALKTVRTVTIAQRAGTLKPAEEHRFTRELDQAVDEFAEARDILHELVHGESVDETRTNRIREWRSQLADRHSESVANAIVREELLASVDQMVTTIGSCQRGMQHAVAVIGTWSHGGRAPDRSTLRSARDGLAQGVDALNALEGQALAFAQQVRWFDANRGTGEGA